MAIQARGFGEGKRLPPGKYRLVLGRGFVPADEAPLVIEHDSTNIRSVATGVAVEQVAEMNRQFGHLGVKYHPLTGDAYYRDRQARLRTLKARGYHDRQEIRG